MNVNSTQSSTFPLYYREYANESEKKEVENFRDLTPEEIRKERIGKIVLVVFLAVLWLFFALLPITCGLGFGLGFGLTGVINTFQMVFICSTVSTLGTTIDLAPLVLIILFLNEVINFNYEGPIHGYATQHNNSWDVKTEVGHLFNDSLTTFRTHLKYHSNLATFYRHHLLSKEDYEAIKAQIARYRKIESNLGTLEREKGRAQPVAQTHFNTLIQNKHRKIAKIERRWEIARKQLPMFIGHPPPYCSAALPGNEPKLAQKKHACL